MNALCRNFPHFFSFWFFCSFQSHILLSSTIVHAMTDLVSEIKTHYEQLRDEDLEQRKQSKIIQLRSFNNWVKATLISEHCKPHSSVLDICGGKGGDLRKWKIANVSHLVLAGMEKRDHCAFHCHTFLSLV
jgi:hypothetical protein